ncbi:SpoIIE family protein phosphatase [Streptomyces thermodiastaticus]
MTSERSSSSASGDTVPDLAELAGVVARQRAEMDRLQEQAATSTVVERAKGALMALTGCTPEAAHEELVQRAKTARHTLVEECWITLGNLVPPPERSPSPATAAPASGPDGAGTVGHRPAPGAAPAPASDGDDNGDAAALALLGRALVHVGSPQDLARCVQEHLAGPVGADAVLLYQLLPGGGLDLIGHAGIDETLAHQWHHIPPLSDVAAFEALESHEPRWLEGLVRDGKRYLLMNSPGRHWSSRAWLPMLGDGRSDVAMGVLRTRGGPFDRRSRALLRGAARLCAGRLRALDTRPERVTGAPEEVRTLFSGLPVPTALLTPLRSPAGEVDDYRVDAATPQTVDVLGRSGPDLVGRRALECWPTLAEEPLWQGLQGTLDEGVPFESEPYAQQEVAAGGRELSLYSVRASRAGEGLLVTWLRQESSDRQVQRLADVQRLGRLGWATWNLVTHEAAWSSQVYELCDRSPEQGPMRVEELARLPVSDDAPALARAVRALLDHGEPFSVLFRKKSASGLRHLRIVAEAVRDADGTPVQVHGFVQDLTAQRNAELALRESERAIAAQQGVLHVERMLAGRLQHALLPMPRRPLRLAGLRVDLAYLPAQSGVHVGGDWFSAIDLPNGDALFVVGDVAGHGLDAVATMAQLRFTAKGMILTGSSLTDALDRLNTLLLHSLDTRGTATLVLAHYQPAERRLVWAQAGHLPPLLLREGRPRYLKRPLGMLLGATEEPLYEEAECRLEPGDRLLLFTDGLVERPGEGIETGLARLAETVAEHHRTDAAGSLDPLLTAMLRGERRDDVCVLDIRVPRETACL